MPSIREAGAGAATPTPWARLSEIVCGKCAAQRLRCTQSGLTFLLVSAYVIVLSVWSMAGILDPDRIRWWALFSVASTLSMFGLIRSGWSLRLADPSMTQPQVLIAIAIAAWAYAVSSAVHGIVPLVLAAALFFGMFGLTTKQIRRLGLLSLSTFSCISVVMIRLDPVHYPAAQEGGYLAMIALSVAAMVGLSSRMVSMKNRLRSQKYDLQHALMKIQQLATHDELTGLVNRRQMLDLMRDECARSLRGGRPLSLALLDIDLFKRVNDLHGHAAGDKVLQAFAAEATAKLRTTDVIARWGGEEFLLMIPDASAGQALASVDRLREHIAALLVTSGSHELRVTVSAGIAQHIAGEPLAQTIERADDALYKAKAQGRNRVETAFGPRPDASRMDDAQAPGQPADTPKVATHDSRATVISKTSCNSPSERRL